MIVAETAQPRWIELTRFLALDVMIPLWVPMGLGDLDRDSVRTVALAATRDERPLQVQGMKAKLLDAARDLEGKPAGAWLARWVDASWVITFEDNPAWWSLRRCLDYVRVKPGRHHWLQLDEREVRRMLASFAEAQDIGDVDELIDRLRQEPFSERDLVTMVDAGYDPDVSSVDPFAFARSVVRIRRVQRWLAGAVPKASPDSLERLHAGLNGVARHLKHQVTIPPLPELVQALP